METRHTSSRHRCCENVGALWVHQHLPAAPAHVHTHTHQLNIPLDSLESTAGHVDDAPGGSGYCTHQTFSKPFKEAGCALPLSSCRPTLASVRGTSPETSDRSCNTFDWFGDDPCDPTDKTLKGGHIHTITELTIHSILQNSSSADLFSVMYAHAKADGMVSLHLHNSQHVQTPVPFHPWPAPL